MKKVALQPCVLREGGWLVDRIDVHVTAQRSRLLKHRAEGSPALAGCGSVFSSCLAVVEGPSATTSNDIIPTSAPVFLIMYNLQTS
jgi:hypothetical protein